MSSITVSELTNEAGVSRMTYYRNYSSKDEILQSYLADIIESYRSDVVACRTKEITTITVTCCTVMSIFTSMLILFDVCSNATWATACCRR